MIWGKSLDLYDPQFQHALYPPKKIFKDNVPPS